MKKQIVVSGMVAACAMLAFANIALAAIIAPPPSPTTLADCKKDGWRGFSITSEDQELITLFKNQGDCVSFVATDAKNAPDGPAIN